MRDRLCSPGVRVLSGFATVASLLAIGSTLAYGQRGSGGCASGTCPSAGIGSRGAAPFSGLRNHGVQVRRLDQPTGHYRALVRIKGETARGQNLGSGVVVRWATKAVVVTAAHVVRGCRKVFVRPGGIRSSWVECVQVRVEPTWDIAFCELSRNDVAELDSAWIAFGADATPAIGTPVESCGFGANDTIVINSGTVLRYVANKPGIGQRASLDWIDISGPSRQGDSGGPVFNSQGEVVGILWGTDVRTTTATQAGLIHHYLAEAYGPWDGTDVPSEEVATSMPEMKRLPLIGRGGSGVSPPQAAPSTSSDAGRTPVLPWRGDVERLEKQNADANAANAAAMARIADQLSKQQTQQPQQPTIPPVVTDTEPPSVPTWAIWACVIGAVLVGGFIFYVVQQN
jgi:S1-C subfamily serine protease